jgi:hypothetical protein
VSDNLTKPVMDLNYAATLKKRRRRAAWFPALLSAAGLLFVGSTISESGFSDWSSLMSDCIIVALAWCYYLASTMRDVEQVKVSGAAALVDGMAAELGREWRWVEKYQSFELRDVDED